MLDYFLARNSDIFESFFFFLNLSLLIDKSLTIKAFVVAVR